MELKVIKILVRQHAIKWRSIAELFLSPTSNHRKSHFNRNLFPSAGIKFSRHKMFDSLTLDVTFKQFMERTFITFRWNLTCTKSHICNIFSPQPQQLFNEKPQNMQISRYCSTNTQKLPTAVWILHENILQTYLARRECAWRWMLRDFSHLKFKYIHMNDVVEWKIRFGWERIF